MELYALNGSTRKNMQQEGIPKFARPDQVLYKHEGKVVITSYLGEAHRCLISDPGKMDWYNFSVADLYLQAVNGILTYKKVSFKHILMIVPENLKQRLMLTNRQVKQMSHEEIVD